MLIVTFFITYRDLCNVQISYKWQRCKYLLTSSMNFWRRLTRSAGPMRVCTARSLMTLKSALTSSESPSHTSCTQTHCISSTATYMLIILYLIYWC